MSMKMLWLLALICRDFPCIICSKKNQICCWHWKCCGGGLHATGSRQEEPSRLACTAKRQRGNNTHAWVLPLGTGGNGGSKKIPGGGFLALGMLRSAAKVGLTGHIFRKRTEMKSKGYPSPNVNAQRPTQPSVQSLPFTLYNFIPHPSAQPGSGLG